LLRKAAIHDEDWTAEADITDPRRIAQALQDNAAKVDVFTFTQKLPRTEPRYNFHYEWDNVAAICTAKFEEWWEELPQEARKNFRRSKKRGVAVRTFQLDDDAVRGIKAIYDEVPVRQGRPFAHFGKDFEIVKREAATLADRSVFVGAFFGDQLIGFIRLVFMGEIASILNIISMNAHYDKRPSNALIVAAAEMCRDRQVSYLLYGKYVYGRKLNSPLTEFKKRTGFRQIGVPRYYVPFTLRGRLYLSIGLHRRLVEILPPSLIDLLVGVRSSVLRHVRPAARS
jgi:hypothetical protein